MCHVPFLLTGTYFRLSFAVLSAAYLDKLGLIPILIFWIANVAIGYKLFDRSCHPLWLISFVSIFIPVCFGIKDYKHGSAKAKRMINLQYNTFWYQTIASVVLYIPCLIGIFVVIEQRFFGCSEKIYYTNYEFRWHIFLSVVMGLLSVILAYCPNCAEGIVRMVECCKNSNCKKRDYNIENASKKNKAGEYSSDDEDADQLHPKPNNSEPE